MGSLSDIRRFFRGTIKLSEPLAKYTALQVGGAADYFLEPSSVEEYTEQHKNGREKHYRYGEEE